MPVGSMVSVDSCHPYDRFPDAFLKRLHGVDGEIAHIQIPAGVLLLRIRAEGEAIEQTPLIGLIDHPVGLNSGHFPIAAKEHAGELFSILAASVLDIPDGGFGSPLRSVAAFDKIGFNDGHYRGLPSPSPLANALSHSSSIDFICGVLRIMFFLASLALPSTILKYVFSSKLPRICRSTFRLLVMRMRACSAEKAMRKRKKTMRWPKAASSSRNICRSSTLRVVACCRSTLEVAHS